MTSYDYSPNPSDSWQLRLAHFAEAAGLRVRDITVAWRRETGRGMEFWKEDMPRFIGTGYAPDGPENGDDGLPFLIDEVLEYVDIQSAQSLVDFDGAERAVWEFQDLLSHGLIEVIPVNADVVAYFAHPASVEKFPGVMAMIEAQKEVAA